MRDIKFRAWHFGHNIMFSAEEMAHDQLTLLTTGKFINVHGAAQQLSTIFEHHEMIPMQYTGIKDKNGVEIFEGDIWGNVYGLDLKATVIFHDGRWALRWDNGSIGDLHAHVTTKSGEVIGNIHQHKHLIESK